MSTQHPYRFFGLFTVGAFLLLGGAFALAQPAGASPAISLPGGNGAGGPSTRFLPGVGAPAQGNPTPTPIPTSFPDLVPRINWACIPLRVQLTTRCANCINPYRAAGPSTMRFENHNGDHVDIPVPGLNYMMPEYTYDCVFGSCVPNAWLAALPFTLTVDIFNDVVEPDETNNVAVLNTAPPPCPAITPTLTATPANPTPTPPPPATDTPTNSATPTLAPPTATSTPTVATTATVCPVQFSDVDPSNPFYPYIRCLACRNIISGYSTSPPCAVAPCFNGGATITRGQVAKIVITAAGFNDVIPSTRQSFSDVPYGSPFWLYIERAYAHNVLSGYDGVCALYHYSPPCFLTGNAVTRGQVAKIAANAAAYSEPIPSTQQTFTDVPYGSPFWLYVERAALHGVISGYGTSPPCSGGVPCFLTGNSLTRNQAAKVVANTFYPGCQTRARR